MTVEVEGGRRCDGPGQREGAGAAAEGSTVRSAFLGARLSFGSGGRLLVAPGLGVDVDDVAVLGEAVDEGDDAGGTREDGVPLLVGEVGGDEGGALLVPRG